MSLPQWPQRYHWDVIERGKQMCFAFPVRCSNRPTVNNTRQWRDKWRQYEAWRMVRFTWKPGLNLNHCRVVLVLSAAKPPGYDEFWLTFYGWEIPQWTRHPVKVIAFLPLFFHLNTSVPPLPSSLPPPPKPEHRFIQTRYQTGAEATATCSSSQGRVYFPHHLFILPLFPGCVCWAARWKSSEKPGFSALNQCGSDKVLRMTRVLQRPRRIW